MKTNRGKIEYLCRRCGNRHGNTHTPNLLISICCALNGLKQPYNDGFQVGLHDVHNCKDGNLGVSDLIGGDFDPPAARIE